MTLDLCQSLWTTPTNRTQVSDHTVSHLEQLLLAWGIKEQPESRSSAGAGLLITLSSWSCLSSLGPKPRHRHSPVQSRGSSPCWQVEKDGPVRCTVSAVNSSMMSTPSACLDTQGSQPGQKNSLSTTFNTIVGREQHLCQPLQHLLLLGQYIRLAAGPGLHVHSKYMLMSGQRKKVRSFTNQETKTCSPGRVREGVHALGEEVSIKGYSPQDKDQASRGTLTHRK